MSNAARLTKAIGERERVLFSFVEREKGQIAVACHAMARAFSRGGTLLAYGVGPAETDAAHVAVEFMHPVIVGKRALPALAPPNDVLELARSGDVALSLAHGREPEAVRSFREEARRRGLLTIAMTGGEAVAADFCFAVPSDDPKVVQEVQETTYHVLWELVHVFFEHPGLLNDTLRVQAHALDAYCSPEISTGRGSRSSRCITCGDVAVEARVVAVHNGTAVIEKDGLREEIAVELVESVEVGDRLLCHAGVALEKLA
jgi:D-sedoheptulose 7-phosphate isomerase